MYKGNPKLTCNDEVCEVCKQTFKDIVQPLPRYGYCCENCREQINKENRLSKESAFAKRLEVFEANRDYIAEDLGWKKDDKNIWHHSQLNQSSIEHPVPVDDPQKLLAFVPEHWIVRYDHEDIMAYDSSINTDRPVEIRYFDNPRYFYTLLIDHDGFTSDKSLIYDMLEMIVNIRKLESKSN